jgi:prolyl-tRNA editing enzyme YbaK/EbsC (Cys-tRNA(Pro) deacylase)
VRTSVDVHNHLVERDVQHELFNVGGRLRRPDQIAAVLDLPPDQVGKVVLFESDQGPLAVLVASDQEPATDLVKREAGVTELTPATPPRASELSDYLHEAIPPVGLPRGFLVIMDRDLAGHEVLYFHGGDPTAVLKVRGEDLARATEAKVAAITT